MNTIMPTFAIWNEYDQKWNTKFFNLSLKGEYELCPNFLCSLQKFGPKRPDYII